MRRFCFLLILIIALSMQWAAQGSEYLVRPITLDNGLSQSSARCVLRDNKGFLWIGTDFGLNRYDNDKVVNYYFDSAKKGTITDQQVEFLTLDPKGDLLVGLSHGLVRYNYITDTFDEILTDSQQPINAKCARVTKDGVLLGSYGKLYFYESKTQTAKLLPAHGGSNSAYYSISKTWSPGCYILQTKWDGIWLYNSTSSTISRIGFCKEKNINAVEIDSNGNLWVAPFDKGLLCYDHSGNLLADLTTANSDLTSDIVYAIVEFENQIWIGSEQGIDIVNMTDYKVTNFDQRIGVPNNCTILCLTPEHNGTIYAGTLRHGVLCVHKVPMRTFTHLKNDLTFFGFTVTSIIPSDKDHKVWIGLDGEGVALFDPIEEVFTHVPSTANMKVTSLTPYDDDHILMATYNHGILLLNTKTFALSPAPPVFERVKELSGNKSVAVNLYKMNDGRILAITDQIFAITPATSNIEATRFTGIRSSPEALSPIYFDGKTLLVNDKHHLYRFIAGADTCGVVFTSKPNENITAAAYDGKSIALIATNKNLFKHDIATSTSIPLKSDLLHNINSLIMEKDRAWIGADNKLFVGSPGNTITMFGPTDGMAPNQFINKAKLVTGDYLLLGGVNGLLKINREDIKDLLSRPANAQISISDVFVDNTRIHVNDGIAKIPNDHSTVRVNIIDHDTSGVRNKLFKYTIEGLKRDLNIETFDRYISLNLLPSGDYKVLVSYSTNDGKWSKPEEILKIHVACPWYEKWWAILIYICLFISALVITYFVVRDKRRRRHEEMKQHALLDKVNFLTHLHTELRTPLTLILSPLSNIIDKFKSEHENKNPEALATLQDIYNNSMHMRDIIEALPETKNLDQFPKDEAKESKKEKKERPDLSKLKKAAPEEEAEEPNLLDNFDASSYVAFIVEENEKLMSFMVSHLQSVFKKVKIAKTAKDALRAIKETQPDIIIADVDLKGENGYDFCSQIKNTPGLRHIPVILLTSGNTLGQKRKSYTHGADSYISKPFDIEVLVSRCKNLLLNRDIMRNRYEKSTAAEKMANKPVSNSEESFIFNLNHLIEENLANPKLGVDFLCKNMLLSRTTFYARMRQLTGKSIGQYISDYRLTEAKKMLTMSKQPINEISEALGFSSQRYFSTFFKEKTGLSPSEFRTTQTDAK